MTAPIHLCPPPSGYTPCCGLAPYEIPGTDRVTTNPALATCTEENTVTDDDWAPEPQQGRCNVTSWTMRGDTRLDEARILGEMTWADLIAKVEAQGGTRPTYDLFDIPNGDGTVTRYRAVDIYEERA